MCSCENMGENVYVGYWTCHCTKINKNEVFPFSSCCSGFLLSMKQTCQPQGPWAESDLHFMSELPCRYFACTPLILSTTVKLVSRCMFDRERLHSKIVNSLSKIQCKTIFTAVDSINGAHAKHLQDNCDYPGMSKSRSVGQIWPAFYVCQNRVGIEPRCICRKFGQLPRCEVCILVVRVVLGE